MCKYKIFYCSLTFAKSKYVIWSFSHSNNFCINIDENFEILRFSIDHHNMQKYLAIFFFYVSCTVIQNTVIDKNKTNIFIVFHLRKSSNNLSFRRSAMKSFLSQVAEVVSVTRHFGITKRKAFTSPITF